MTVERSGQAIDVETSKGQLETGGARGFDGGRQLSSDSTSRMNRDVQVRISVRGSGCDSLGVLGPHAKEEGSGHLFEEGPDFCSSIIEQALGILLWIGIP